MKLFKVLVFSVLLLFFQVAFGQLKLPKIFTDNMVLQRDQQVRIWGKAEKDQKISVAFNRQTLTTKSNSNGDWDVVFQPMKYGGPFNMVVQSKHDKITLKNILIGDVWVCSGQSNMEFPMNGWTHVNNFKQEIANANHPNIRLFSVEKSTSYLPKDDFKGGSWLVCDSSDIAPFSAVAYFFGRKLNRDLNVPIGLINSTWGGTNIEDWISWDKMGLQNGYRNIDPKDSSKIEAVWNKNRAKFEIAMKTDVGAENNWYLPSTITNDWLTTELPNSWDAIKMLAGESGVCWFRRQIDLTESQIEKDITLNLGVIDDKDETYINGQKVGEIDDWYTPRVYKIKKGILKAGLNTIIIRATNISGGGGFVSPKNMLYLEVGDEHIPIAGQWLYKPTVLSSNYHIVDPGPNAFPSLLYNAMIAPMINFSIKGVAWYQGENNTNEPKKYYSLFPMLINNWRSKWKEEMPFCWVQLANYLAPTDLPKESNWAELRDAQNSTLKLPKTGQAVIIDLGEADNIHPKDKQDVGYRLALAALKVAYNKNIIYSGPSFHSMNVIDNKIEIQFDNIGSGLEAKGDKYKYVKGFAIAGADRHFFWAKAYIQGDNVIVSSDKVKAPKFVRYAWADNPDDANLYNKENLPASPFEAGE